MADPERPQAPAGRLAGPDVEARLARIDELLAGLEDAPGPSVRSALEAVGLLTEVYGEALARMLEHVDDERARRLGEDELLEHLLVLHGIHPDSPERRAERAVERLRPAVRESGGDLEWGGVADRVARVRVSGPAGGCGSGCGGGGGGTAGLEDAVRAVVLAAAPELTVEPVPAEAERRPAAPAFVPLGSVARRSPDASGARGAG
ncbi:NifU family protein [Streptomyces sp. NPDC047017]|uniref:NifU family protein n=1 Tax=Streptomyces sp. NPDC047017 TaxID=3155024 RepID=UPI0033E66015